jgi:uncharacterized membrane protein
VRRKLLSILALLLALSDRSFARPVLEAIPAPPDKLLGIYGVSHDGSTLSGLVTDLQAEINQFPIDEPFVWTRAEGVRLLGHLPGLSRSSNAYAVAARRARGIVAVGSSLVAVFENEFGWEEEIVEAFVWTPQWGLEGLGFPEGDDTLSAALAVTPDGNTVVGYAGRPWMNEPREAFRWTRARGFVGLGDLPGGLFDSSAQDVTPDGSVIVGQGSTESGGEAFRWTRSTGMMGLGRLTGYTMGSIAHAVSADGRTVVGSSSAPLGREAFIWRWGKGMTGLGFPAPGTGRYSDAVAVSCDGKIVVGGFSSDELGHRTFHWTQKSGMRLLEDVLEDDYGLHLSGWTLYSIAGMSEDGRVLAGNGVAPSGEYGGWRAVLRERSARRAPNAAPRGERVLVPRPCGRAGAEEEEPED